MAELPSIAVDDAEVAANHVPPDEGRIAVIVDAMQITDQQVLGPLHVILL